MNRQRGLGIIGYLIGAAIAAAAVTASIIWINHFIYVTWEVPAYGRGHRDGVAEQLAADEPIVEGVKKERDAAKSDLATSRGNFDNLKSTCDAQSEATARARAAADRAKAAAIIARAEADRRAKDAAPKLADLQAKAADRSTKLLACQEELDVTAGALRDALRERRQGKAPAVPSKK